MEPCMLNWEEYEHLKPRFLKDASEIAQMRCWNVKGCSKTDMAKELRARGWKGMRAHEVASFLEDEEGFSVKHHGATGGGWFETIHYDGPEIVVEGYESKKPEEKLSIIPGPGHPDYGVRTKAKIPATRIECSNDSVIPRPKLKLAAICTKKEKKENK